MKKLILIITALAISHNIAFSQGCLPNGITFTTQNQIDSFQVNHPGCTEVEGDVMIGEEWAGTDIINLNGLSTLTSIGGALSMKNNPLISLNGLENLNYIGGNLTIGNLNWGCHGNDSLVDLTGLNGLDSIGGDLYIDCNEGLTSLAGLEGLTFIGGSLKIGNTASLSPGGNPSLTSLSGLSNLTTIEGSILIGKNGALTSLTGLEGVTTLQGGVGVCYSPGLIDLTGLDNLSYIGGGVDLYENNFLVSLSGLDHLDSIDGSLYIGDCYEGTTNPHGGNEALASLNGLENLTRIGGELNIGQNPSLTSLAGLDNIEAGSITNLMICGDTSLSACKVQSICDYLASPNGYILISNNAPGCDSPEEVLAACETHCLPEGITFTTQEQIDNFQTNYPGCTEIEGNVMIGGMFNTITNLDGLSVLTAIGGDLSISWFFLTNLSGFDNLTSIGGSLYISMDFYLSSLGALGNLTYISGDLVVMDNDSLTSLTGLENVTFIGGSLQIGNLSAYYGHNVLSSLTGLGNLTSVGGCVSIEGNDSLVNMSGLDNLTSVGGCISIRGNTALTSLSGLDNINAASVTDLNISDNALLSTCNVQSLCNYLASPNGTVDIYANAAGCNNPTEIANNCGISLPCLPFGNYYFFSQADIDNFQSNYSGCNELGGNVTITGDDITNVIGLNPVTSIGGEVIIGAIQWPYVGNPALTSLTGLENLTHIGGDLWINNNDSLTSLTGLDNLNSIGGDLSIGWMQGVTGRNMEALNSITALGNLTSIGGELSISGTALTSLSGLDSVTSIGGGIVISGNDSLTTLSGLDNLPFIGGDLQISYNGLTTLSGLDNLISVAGQLFISGNDALTNLTGLENLNHIGGVLWVINNDSLKSLTGLGSLTSIGGHLQIYGDSTLISLTGLEGLTSIGGTLYIGHNPDLTSLLGLNNINCNSIMELTIMYNISLSTCAVKSICDYLAAPNGEIHIGNNAPGCNSQAEVQAACMVSVSEVGSRQSAVSSYPNPFSSVAMFEYELKEAGEVTLTIFNNISKEIEILIDERQSAGKHLVMWNAEVLPGGIYFFRMRAGNELGSGKMVKY